jgi:hypothetical protein
MKQSRDTKRRSATTLLIDQRAGKNSNTLIAVGIIAIFVVFAAAVARLDADSAQRNERNERNEGPVSPTRVGETNP